MDFFARQEQSRRATRRLVALFGLAFFAIAVFTAAAATVAIGMYAEYDPVTFGTRTWQQWAADNLPLLGTIVLITMGLMVLASLFRAKAGSSGNLDTCITIRTVPRSGRILAVRRWGADTD